jgi:RNA polymerase sigma factor (sigma-70 family)
MGAEGSRSIMQTVTPIDAGNHRARVLDRRDELVREHLTLVASIARGIKRRLPPSFDLDDLIAIGNVALMHAAGIYRPQQHGGCPFPVFARTRIRGAILDGARRRNWVENTRAALPLQICDAEACITNAVQVIDEAIDLRRRAARVAEALARLPVEQQRVLEEYYSAWQPTLTQVAQRLGLSRHQVGHQHRAALAALRAWLKAA